MDIYELRDILAGLNYRLLHEVIDDKDYYLCLLRKEQINKFIPSFQKNQSFDLYDFKQICDSRTLDILDSAEDNNTFVLFVDVLDINDSKYIEKVLFLYKHVSNIMCYKITNTYFDKETFKNDLINVLDPNKKFNFVKKFDISPNGRMAESGDYRMRSKDDILKERSGDNENVHDNLKTQNPAQALDAIFKEKEKNSLEQVFNIKDFERINPKEKDFRDHIIDHIDNTTSLISDVIIDRSNALKNKVVEKAPVVKENAKKIGKVVGKKIGNAIKDNVSKIEKNITINKTIKDLDISIDIESIQSSKKK